MRSIVIIGVSLIPLLLLNQTPTTSGSGGFNEASILRILPELQKLANGGSLPTLLNPFGEMWQSASRMLSKGVHKFRESLHEGVKVAHLLKEDVDEGVAKLMSKNQQEPQPVPAVVDSIDEQQLLREGVLGGLLRFMGVNSNQLGVIALNVLIIVAEWITSSFLGGSENTVTTSRMVKDNLLQWVVNGHNPKLETLIQDAKNHSLPESLIKTLITKTGNDTSCVQLLICKMSPVIWGIQKTVEGRLENARKNGNETSTTSDSEGTGRTLPSVMDSFLGSLPAKTAFVDFGDDCEKRFPYCKLLKFEKTHLKANQT